MSPAVRVLGGLPASGPWPEQFSASGKGTHREGFVVEFNPGLPSAWVGNFQAGLTNYYAVIPYPGSDDFIVFAGGQGYVIDPSSRQLVTLFDGGVDNTMRLYGRDILIVSNLVRLKAYTGSGQLWQTRRISWDGIRDLREADGRIWGVSWDALTQKTVPFSVNIHTGEVDGGVSPHPPE